MGVTGYLHSAYAKALADFGAPRQLPASGAWILRRQIPRSTHHDGMGCYPLFSCLDWHRLGDDLRCLERELVALSVVTDPFGDQSAEQLSRAFPDLVVPFKQHFVVDLQTRGEPCLDAHHRRNVRKGLDAFTVERVDDATECGDDWVALYAVLKEKHQIRGFADFSERSLREQLGVPGAVAFKATRDGATAGITIWYLQRDDAYYHLGAYSPSGYERCASYAIFATAIEQLRAGGVRRLDLGAGAGLRDDQSSGLSRFKRGWSTGTRPAYLCGRILNRQAYASLAAASGQCGSEYFPAYRAGESA